MRYGIALTVLFAAGWLAVSTAHASKEEPQDPWAAFLDYAYTGS